MLYKIANQATKTQLLRATPSLMLPQQTMRPMGFMVNNKAAVYSRPQALRTQAYYDSQMNGLTQWSSQGVTQQFNALTTVTRRNHMAVYDSYKGMCDSGSVQHDEKQEAVIKQLEDLINGNDMKSVYIWGDPGCGKTFILE